MQKNEEHGSRRAKRRVEAPEFLAASPATQKVAQALQKASGTDFRVILYGEPGVGKSLAARCLHALSTRGGHPLAWVPVRESATIWRLSDRSFLDGLTGGTLVLAGIDEAPTDVQGVLVGVIEEWGTAAPAGEVPVRILATAQRDLLALVETKAFRQDLYYLTDVFPLAIPPLRERPEEIPMFVDHFFRRHVPGRNPPPIPESFLQEAVKYGWPGNLLELERVVLSSLPQRPGRPWQFPHALPLRGGTPKVLSFSEAKKEFEVSFVRRALILTSGNVTRAAELAGKSRKDFYTLMARTRIDPAPFRRERRAAPRRAKPRNPPTL